MISALRTAFCLALFAASLPAGADDGKTSRDKDPLKGVELRLLGPFIGGRVARVAGVPGDPRTYYAATASGGVWKSTNGGQTGSPSSTTSRSPPSARSPSPRPIRTSSTSAPARPTSAATSRPATASTSRPTRGKTWKHVWKQEGQIGTMVVHPKQPRRRLRRRARPRLRPQPGARRLPHDATAARPGSRCSRRTRTPAPRDVALRPLEPAASSSPASGRRGAGPGS